MRYQSKSEIEKAQKKLETEEGGVTYHEWKDMVNIKATGTAPKNVGMPKDKIYREHRLAADCLVNKGYAVYA